MPKLPKRVQLLVDALESGKYQQAQGSLRNRVARLGRYNYCCLGVACDVFRKETGQGKWDGESFLIGAEEATEEMPRQVRDWFGFFDQRGKSSGLLGTDGEDDLIDLNDNTGKSLKEIAGAIRENWKDMKK